MWSRLLGCGEREWEQWVGYSGYSAPPQVVGYSGYSALPKPVVQPSISKLWCLLICLRICWFVCFWETAFGCWGQCSPAGLAVLPCPCGVHVASCAADGDVRAWKGSCWWVTLVDLGSPGVGEHLTGVSQFQKDPMGFQNLWESLEEHFCHGCQMANAAHVRNPAVTGVHTPCKHHEMLMLPPQVLLCIKVGWCYQSKHSGHNSDW